MTTAGEVRSHPRRVAIVTQGFSRGGGVSTVVRWLRSGLESTGNYSVDIHDLATSSQDASSRRLVQPQTWLRKRLGRPSDSDTGVQHWGANAVEVEFMRYRPRAELTSTLRNYDLIQVVNGAPAIAAAVMRVGIPVVLQVATTAAWERESQLASQVGIRRVWRQGMAALTARIERSALNDVDMVLVENDVMLEHVRSIGQHNVVKAFPGLDTDRFIPEPTGWRGNGHLLSVCRFGDARKGLERLVLAYAEMVQVNPQIPDLVLAGLGGLPSAISDIIRRVGVESRVRVLSGVDETELVRLYQGASVFLQTSHEEGLGMSVLEAMSCGLPVVCTDTAGTRETVDSGVTGWLVAQGRDAAVAAAVANRVLAVLDGGGEAMGVRGRDRCLRIFSLDVTLRRFIAAYDSLALLPLPKTADFKSSARLRVHTRNDP
jgi:glycosyltransferase involved in cell wall biosynthesis